MCKREITLVFRVTLVVCYADTGSSGIGSGIPC